LQEKIKENNNKIIIKIIVLISIYILVKYYKFQACKSYFNNLVKFVFIVNNKYNYIKVYIDIIYKYIKTIIIIVIINKDTTIKEKDKKNKNKILSINRVNININYILN